MIYMESYESSDWPSVGGQFQTGLNVQLPGSENFLPVQNGYQLDTAANLLHETKYHSKVNVFSDITEDDWNCFGAVQLTESGDLYGHDLVFDGYDGVLPASPEIVSYDLNAFSEDQGSSQATHYGRSSTGSSQKSEQLTDVVAVSGSGLCVESCRHQMKNVPEDILESSGYLCDFDPTWLFSPMPILPSLEEVESVLSASPPLEVISEDDPLSPTGIEIRAKKIQFAPAPLQFREPLYENPQPFESPFDIIVTDNIGMDSSCVTDCSSVQASPNVTWIGDNAPGQSLRLTSGFFDFDSTSFMVPSSDSSSSSESNRMISPLDVNETGSDTSLRPITSSPVFASPRVEPYPTFGVKPERRERKREQNKTAALKYRQKKRVEQDVFMSECDQLEKRNSELKGRVEELAREISYLRGLMLEIYSSRVE